MEIDIEMLGGSTVCLKTKTVSLTYDCEVLMVRRMAGLLHFAVPLIGL